MKIYFAAPMFAKSDLLYNEQIVKEVRAISSKTFNLSSSRK